MNDISISHPVPKSLLTDLFIIKKKTETVPLVLLPLASKFLLY